MKKPILYAVLALILCAGFNFKSKAATGTYFIYVKATDKQFAATRYQKTVSISYLCKCYVNKANLSFLCVDDSKDASIKTTLPPKYMTMGEFAAIALNKSVGKKNADLNKAEIYVVQDYPQHKYRYFKVKFYTA